MIGIIITGHGDFSNGLKQAFQMIAGKPENVMNICFEEGADLTSFQNQLKDAFAEYSEKYDGVIVLTDLLGGTPFNTSMMASQEFENVRVLAGTNLPMVIEGQLFSLMESDVDKLAKQIVEVGQQAVSFPQISLNKDDDNEIEEGI